MSLDKLSSLRRPAGQGDPAPPAPREKQIASSGATKTWTYAVPIAALAAAALLFAIAFRDRLLPATEVEVARVLAIRAEGGAAAAAAPAAGARDGAPDLPPAIAGEMLFQASGWVEPDPLPIKATALASGVVREVHVLEGQAVKSGQILASLVDDDAKLALDAAQAAKVAIEERIHAHCEEIPVVEAQIEAALREADAAAAKLAELQDEAERLARLPKGSAPEREVAQAALRAESQKAQLAMAKAAVPKLEAELKKIDAERAALEATVAAAEVEVAKAKLTLGRMEVPSPADGIVLRLLAVPGGKRMLEMDDPDSSTVAILFEPDKLQVRADVPLAEAGNLAVGQPAKITCDLLPDAAFTGVVTRIVGEADIARNTLQAKVRIYDPDPRLRPEMLCRVQFFAPPAHGNAGADSPAASAAGGGRLTLYAPESGIRGGSGSGSGGNARFAWVVGADGQHAERRDVRLAAGTPARDGYAAVAGGLRPGDLVILEPGDLAEGERIRFEQP